MFAQFLNRDILVDAGRLWLSHLDDRWWLNWGRGRWFGCGVVASSLWEYPHLFFSAAPA